MTWRGAARRPRTFMALYAYVRPTDDNNHAPHVSRGLLSLANCVWMVRERAQVGDWILGLTSVTKHEDGHRRLSFLARVDEKLSRDKYWQRYARSSFGGRHGRLDNFYAPGTCYPFFRMRPNSIRPYWSQACDKDMKSKWVILSRTFKDFGPETDVKLTRLSNPWGLHLDRYWNPIHLSLVPPKSRHYRRFPFDVVDLENLVLDWERP